MNYDDQRPQQARSAADVGMRPRVQMSGPTAGDLLLRARTDLSRQQEKAWADSAKAAADQAELIAQIAELEKRPTSKDVVKRDAEIQRLLAQIAELEKRPTSKDVVKRDAEIQRLLAQIAELEKRLASNDVTTARQIARQKRSVARAD